MLKRKYWAWALVNLAIIGLVFFGIWFTGSLWALLGLVFLFSVRRKTVDAICPKCGCKFVAKSHDDEDD